MSKLGQHFLKDKRILGRIVAALDVRPEDTIVEIGPGHGELTRQILEASPQKLVGVEIDNALIENYLNKLVKEHESFMVVHGDILDVLPRIQETEGIGGDHKLVGNIPYYLTGHLLRKIGELKDKPRVIVMTIQKEVAERLCSEPPDMNLLAASVKFWGEPEIVRYISKKSFRPQPAVSSAIIKIGLKNKYEQENAKSYYRFIRMLFKQPRKTIANNLYVGLGIQKSEVEKRLKELGVKPTLRPQDLNVPTINKISEKFLG